MIKPKPSLHASWFLGALLPLAVLVLGLGSFLLLGKQQPRQVIEDPSDPRVQLIKMPIVSIDTIRPFQGIETLDVRVSGTVVPYRQITLASEVAGRILYKSEECRIGRYVHEGDVLFRIDPKDYELDVERLTAMKESEYAQQRELDQELSNASRSLELANQELALLDKELARVESLPPGVVSATEVDQVRRQRITSTNQVLNIQNQLRLLETRRARIQLAEKLASAQLSQALVNLERAQVKAPISGVIVSESVQADSYVQKGTTLCLIEDTERVEVSCNLRTDQLLLILDQVIDAKSTEPSARVLRASSYELPRTPVEISYRVSGRDDTVYQWTGHLSRYEGIGLDSQSRTVPVRITVDDPRHVRRNGQLLTEETNGGLPALVRGMFVEVGIQTKPKQSLVLIPKLAIKPGGQIWKFESDPTLLTTSAPFDVSPVSNNQSDSPAIRVNEWDPGKLRVLTGVNTISLIRVPEAGNAEFWIAEASDELMPGTQTIVTPLANIIGDGNDKVRRSLAKDSANAQAAQGN